MCVFNKKALLKLSSLLKKQTPCMLKNEIINIRIT